MGRRRRLLARAPSAIAAPISGDLRPRPRGVVHHLALQRPLAGSGRAAAAGRDTGPGGSLLDLRAAIKNYFEARSHLGMLSGRTEYPQPVRAADPADGRPQSARRGSRRCRRARDLQRDTRIVGLQRARHTGRTGSATPGPTTPTCIRRGRDRRPAMASSGHPRARQLLVPEPVRALHLDQGRARRADEGEPVESIEVEVRTGDVRYAGTDDDVCLRLGATCASGSTSGSTTTSSAATATPTASRSTRPCASGLRVGDITSVQIEKSRDGIAGGWKLRRREAARQRPRSSTTTRSINRWLEDDHRTWTARTSSRAPRADPRSRSG